MAATCLKISNPTAAIRPARTLLRKLTDSRGNRAIIQVNSSQDTSRDITSDAACSTALSPDVSRIPIQCNTLSITECCPVRSARW